MTDSTPSAETDLSRLDPGMAFRQFRGWPKMLAVVIAVSLSLFHVYTAGFGVLLELKHRSVHLTFVLSLIFLLYPARRMVRRPRSKAWILSMDLLGALLTGFLGTFTFGELFELKGGTQWLVFLAAGGLGMYLRRRETWRGGLAAAADLLLGGGGAILWGLWVPSLWNSWTSWGFGFRTWAVCVALGTGLCLLAILRQAFRRGNTGSGVPLHDLLLAVLAAAGASYLMADFQQLVNRAGLPLERDLLWGALTLLAVLEATRRSVGPDLSVLAMAALVYSYAGPALIDLPVIGFFAHRGFRVDRVIEHMMLGTEGVFGIPLGVVATFVFHFVLFGILVTKTGLGQLFMDAAMVLAGRTRGGPAKVAVLASGFFGSISGSSIANTVTTGTFTIPLMRRLGYTGRYAAAVEATASTGGQITPPIMGAAAFIMAEFINIPYLTIAASAILPAALYYLGVGTMVHLEAVKRNIHGLNPNELPDLKSSFAQNGWMLIPMVSLVVLLIRGLSPFLSAFWGILLSASLAQGKSDRRPLVLPALLTVPFVLWPEGFTGERLSVSLGAWLIAGGAGWFLFPSRQRWTRTASALLATAEIGLVLTSGPFLAGVWGNLLVVLASWGADAVGLRSRDPDPRSLGLGETITVLEQGAQNALSIGAACACVGVVIGSASLTGFGLKFAQGTTQLAGLAAHALFSWVPWGEPLIYQVFLTLLFTMIACTLLGSGLPTTATYIILITFAAPALKDLGIPLLAAHMFILYYGVLSDVIPPVALSAYAGAALAREDPFRTGFTAMRLASAGILVPFVFIYNPDLLLLPWLGVADSTGAYPLPAAIAGVILGIMALGASLTGHFIRSNRWYEGTGLFLAGILLVWPAWQVSPFGAALALIIWLGQRATRSRKGIAG